MTPQSGHWPKGKVFERRLTVQEAEREQSATIRRSHSSSVGHSGIGSAPVTGQPIVEAERAKKADIRRGV
jgi:hypothetical protein